MLTVFLWLESHFTLSDNFHKIAWNPAFNDLNEHCLVLVCAFFVCAEMVGLMGKGRRAHSLKEMEKLAVQARK